MRFTKAKMMSKAKGNSTGRLLMAGAGSINIYQALSFPSILSDDEALAADRRALQSDRRRAVYKLGRQLEGA